MSLVDDVVKNVLDGILREVGKTVGLRKRSRRRKRALTPTERLSRIEKLLKPASRQTSRKKTTRTRSTTQQRRVGAKTHTHRKSLRRGDATR